MDDILPLAKMQRTLRMSRFEFCSVCRMAEAMCARQPIAGVRSGIFLGSDVLQWT